MQSEKTTRDAPAMREATGADQLAAEPTLDRAIQSRIGDHLRAMYDDLMKQPIPDRFSELLGRLDKGEEPSR